MSREYVSLNLRISDGLRQSLNKAAEKQDVYRYIWVSAAISDSLSTRGFCREINTAALVESVANRKPIRFDLGLNLSNRMHKAATRLGISVSMWVTLALLSKLQRDR